MVRHTRGTPEEGFDVTYDHVGSSSGDNNASDAYCSYRGVSEGDEGGVPAGVVTYFSGAIDWTATCNDTTESASGPSTPLQAGDGSWWCLPQQS